MTGKDQEPGPARRRRSFSAEFKVTLLRWCMTKTRPSPMWRAASESTMERLAAGFAGTGPTRVRSPG